jgi:tagatose-1,6-bisphosphate aldolase non-catalytic subunit AgaZ/GatZ
MIQQRLERLLANRCTLLGVGPMSINCVDATIELANDYDVLLMLIASRRQIDSKEFGGGYVNNWTTEKFADYVIERDKRGKVLLARDHGGPWQNPKEVEKNLSLRLAMESAKASYAADLDAGFQILHIDPSIDIHGQTSIDEVLDRIFELYEYCWSYSQRLRKEVLFEIGTDEQTGSTNKQEELDYTLNAVQKFCGRNKMNFPLFVVIQTGTRVMETRNVGSFDLHVRVADEIPPEIQIPKMVELCNRHGIYMKVHNTDYLSNEAIKWYPRLGIHAANVAPEFGVAETNALISILENNKLTNLVERFLQISYDSGKWKKWMVKDTTATDRDKSIIAGHYVFATPEFNELIAEATGRLKNAGIDLNQHLKESVKISILRYIRNFRLIKQ